jgi:hypothetical protein
MVFAHSLQLTGATQTLPMVRPYLSFVPFDPNVLVEDQARQTLFGSLTECLLLFRSVDAAQANLELTAILIEHGDRIAVGDPATTRPSMDSASATEHSDIASKNDSRYFI